MKRLRISPFVLAVVSAVAVAFAFTEHASWSKPPVGSAEPCKITVPSNADDNTCLVQAGIQCKCGVRDVYETEGAANSQDVSKLLRYTP